jgi:hypothetical protein
VRLDEFGGIVELLDHPVVAAALHDPLDLREEMVGKDRETRPLARIRPACRSRST